VREEWTGCQGCAKAQRQAFLRAADIVESYARDRQLHLEFPTPADDIVAALRVAANLVREQV
jgi:hypothetical protein